MSQGKTNPVAIAALPIAVFLTLSALLPYFQVGDSFSEYSFHISGWSYFSTVDLLMLLTVPLAAALLVATLVPELREGRAKVTLGGEGDDAFDFPLVAVPATALGLLGGLIFFLLVLRILFPPDALSQAGGLFFGALLALALAGSAAGSVAIEATNSRSEGGLGPASGEDRGPNPPPPASATPPPAESRPAPPPPSREPPPPAPGSRRG